MIKSLNTGKSGLNSYQVGLDTIGNNISNVNTVAYKAQTTNFDDIMYQNLSQAKAATEERASANARQVGNGVKVGSIDLAMLTPGSARVTNDDLDFRIDGTSFFVVHDGTTEYYTKDGTFEIDANGDLVTRNHGLYVYGWTSQDGVTINTNGPIGKLNIFNVNEEKDTYAEPTSYFRIEGVLDYHDGKLFSADGKTVSIECYGADGTKYTANFSFKDDGDEDDHTFNLVLKSVTDPNGNVTQGSDTGLSIKFGPNGTITSVNGVDGSSGTITMPAVMGGTVATIDLSKLTTKTVPENDVTISGSLPDWVGVDEASLEQGIMGSKKGADGNPATFLDFSGLNADNKSELVNQGFYFTCCTCDRHYSVQFVNGEVAPESQPVQSGRHYIFQVSLDDVNNGTDLVNKILEATNSNPLEHFTMLEGNGANLTLYDERSDVEPSLEAGLGLFGKGVATSPELSVTSLSALKGDANGQFIGLPTGNRNGWSTDQQGIIYADYTNGGKRVIGQMATADFLNPSNLYLEGTNLYSATFNSGEPTIQTIDAANEKILSGQLEMSNVNLADEMTRMILMQRAFQANSKVISTSDSILETTNNIKQ